MIVKRDTLIAAPPGRVWKVLTDPDALVRDTGITRLDGHVARGERLKLWSEVSPDRAFALRVKTFDAPHRMEWKGGMPLGLFTGRRTFDLRPDAGGTHLTVSEAFSGLLARVITRSMPDLGPSMDRFLNAVKAMSEGA